ncbi:MAG: helix-turn-helix transcriptional regulator [Clostridia bacterium]|nr:helix-turn-helix transcriptional regulator [Clostridia bacterium]
MTVGENIKQYREKLGLSQEELGQKLFVSTQTVSLWEKDQTLPTIENLRRLKEIFNTSVDEILGYQNETVDDERKGTEFYKFQFDKNEAKQIYRFNRNNTYLKPIILILFSFFIAFFNTGASSSDAGIGFVWGMVVLLLLLYLRGFINYKKLWKKSLQRMCESSYEYEVFDDYFTVRICRNNETVSEVKYKFSDIEKVVISDKWFFMQISGGLYTLKTNALEAGSKFFDSAIKKQPENFKQSGKVKMVSALLLIITIVSFFAAFITTSSITFNNNLIFTEAMWIMFLFIPIPLASIIFGFVMKAKGYKTKKNIIGGIIILSLLCIYGSFTFISSDMYSHSDEPIKRVEEMLQIDIPEHNRINTTDYTKYNQNFGNKIIHYQSEIFFNDDKTESFENQLPKNSKFLKKIPNRLSGILSRISFVGENDYVLIYNVDTKEYNALPKESGNYNFINIRYSAETNKMEIVEYAIDYVA